MSAADHFIWRESARVFAANMPVPRRPMTALPAFAAIPTQPSHTTLTELGDAILGLRGFAVSDAILPPDLTIAPGTFITQSGGTSGTPKLILRSQSSWTASFRVHAEIFDLHADDCTAVLGRLGHSLALFGVLEAMHLGLDAHALDGLRPATQLSHLRDAGVSVIYATPTQLRLLIAAGNAAVPAVRLILCGGGALDAATRTGTARVFPNAALHVFYGAAETSFITLSDHSTPEGSVGRAYPGVTLEVRGPDGVATNDTGEVWVNSPYLFDGYAVGTSRHTRQQAGWITVGELGRIDDDGTLWLRGRTGRALTIADQSVFPEEIEALIAAHPCGGPCAVLPRPDPVRGCRLIAVLEGAENAARADSIKAACRATFGALATPHRVLFRADLPLLTSGKVDLRALTDWVETAI